MNKIFLFAGLVLLLAACQKHEDQVAPQDLPDARLTQALTDYKTQLTGAQYGWKAVLYPKNGAAYSFLVTFSPNDRVLMASDLNAAAATPKESSYRLKAMQKPSLLFDTYSYMHVLADPDPSKSKGDIGEGQYVDFEFYFDAATPETITLTGQYHGSKLILTKATQAEAASFIPNIAAQAAAFEHIGRFATYFKRLVVGSNVFDVAVDTDLRTITFSYFENNALKTFTTSYYYNETGVVLLEPLVSGSLTISTFQSLQYNTGTGQINLTVNNAPARFQEAISPIRLNPQAARNFYNNPPNGVYYQTLQGFTVNGVPDAHGVGSIANLDVLTFYIQASPPYDGFIFFKSDNSYFGPAVRSNFPADGRITFTNIGSFGTVPPDAAAAVTGTVNQLLIPEGFYVVERANGYDLVSAKDAKAWISLQ